MNIAKFKVGDVITRTERPKNLQNEEECRRNRTEYEAERFIGDRIIFQGTDKDSKMIFLIDKYGQLKEVSFAIDKYDEGWEKFPEEMFKNAKKTEEDARAKYLEKEKGK